MLTTNLKEAIERLLSKIPNNNDLAERLQETLNKLKK